MSSSAPGEQLQQPPRLSELEDPEIAGLTLESFPSPSVSARRLQWQLSPSVNSRGSGRKRSDRFVKLFLPVVSGVVAFYLSYRHGVGKVVEVSNGGINRPDKPPTSATTLHQITDTLTKETLQDTRRASTELNDLTRNYYRGEKQDHQISFESWEASLNIERAAFLSEHNDGGGNNNSIEDVDEDSVNRRLSFAEPKYRAADGCLKGQEVQVDTCLASERSPNVAVNCCAGSMENNNLKCRRDNKCVTRSTFVAAKTYCEKIGMRLCSVAELESGACC
eukprot:scaffold7980_cov88-Skeletonema_menzelii.AAC.6